MTLLRELEEMINIYAPMRPLKEIVAEVAQVRDLPNDPIFYAEINAAIANHYIRVSEAKQQAEDIRKIEGDQDESNEERDI